jgi:hypothetical protein
MNDEIIHFIIGSSLFITIYPYFYLLYIYQYIPDKEKSKHVISLSSLLFLLPVMFGLFLAIVYKITEPIIPRKTNQGIYLRFIVSGSISSLIVSLICHYVFHIQDTWLRMENPESSHIIIPIFYFVVFYTVGVWIRGQILYGPQPTTSSSLVSSTSSSSTPSLPTPSSSFLSTLSNRPIRQPPKKFSPSVSLSTYEQLASKQVGN